MIIASFWKKIDQVTLKHLLYVLETHRTPLYINCVQSSHCAIVFTSYQKISDKHVVNFCRKIIYKEDDDDDGSDTESEEEVAGNQLGSN